MKLFRERLLARLLALAWVLASAAGADEAVNLTRHNGDHLDPSWSADGKTVLFQSTCNPDAHPGWQMQSVRADGSGAITSIEGRIDFRPVMSPDGKRIAFDSYRDGNHEIYISDPDGKNPIRLTKDPAYDSAPSWSPDGQWLVYFSGAHQLDGHPLRTYGNADLWVIEADGSSKRRLTSTDGDDTYPTWSPDGKAIAFTSWRDGNPEIYTIGADGLKERRLTYSPARDDGAKWSADSTAIAFTSNRDGNYEIYAMMADGTRQTNVTRNEAQDAGVAWSRDGKWLAFSSKRGGNWDIYRISAPRLTEAPAAAPPARSGGMRNITRHPSVDLHPSWSRDGRHILFSSDRGPHTLFRDSRLYVASVESSELLALPHGFGDARGTFSPDGSEVVFEADRDGDTDLYVLRVGTESVRPLVDDPGTQSWARWSPNDRRIAFASAEPGSQPDVWIIDADGGSKTNVTRHNALDSSPSWSPDGRKIVFVSNRDGNQELYAIGLESGSLERLTNDPAADAAPAWSPDGKKIAFTRVNDGQFDIVVLDLANRSITNLTNDRAWDHYAAWSGDSCRLAFVSKRDGDADVWVTDACGPPR